MHLFSDCWKKRNEKKVGRLAHGEPDFYTILHYARRPPSVYSAKIPAVILLIPRINSILIN